MVNPWLAIPLEDYEGHMNSAGVQQLAALSDLFKRALDHCSPESVAVLGVAGGNGLEQIDSAITKRIVGVDINQRFLEAVQRRFGALHGLELHQCDLAGRNFGLPPTALVHAALIFEHIGEHIGEDIGRARALENALSMVAPAGRFSAVLQLPSEEEQAVACSGYASMQTLRKDFALIDVSEFQRLLAQHGFQLLEHHRQPVAGGKALWLGMFARSQ